MGLFSWVNFDCNCPQCGEIVSNFQTKDRETGRCDPWEVSNFYSLCSNCKLWIEYSRPQTFKEDDTRDAENWRARQPKNWLSGFIIETKPLSEKFPGTSLYVSECKPTAEITISGGGEASPVSHRLPPELKFTGTEYNGVPYAVFDHENLLRKYIKWVRECSDYTYIHDTMDSIVSEELFNEHEWAELRRLAEV